MKTVGQILKEARERQNLTLAEVSQETRISIAYLTAIEANNFQALPAATFAKGLMQNYAKAIGLNPQTVLAIFRRDYDLDERGNIIPRSLTQPIRHRLTLFTPSTMIVGSTVIVAVLVTIFFVRQIIIMMSAPPLNIVQPTEAAQVINPITIQGTTSPQASVTINNQTINVNPEGAFATSLTLGPGDHTLVVTTTSRSGKARTLQRRIHVEE